MRSISERNNIKPNFGITPNTNFRILNDLLSFNLPKKENGKFQNILNTFWALWNSPIQVVAEFPVGSFDLQVFEDLNNESKLKLFLKYIESEQKSFKSWKTLVWFWYVTKNWHINIYAIVWKILDKEAYNLLLKEATRERDLDMINVRNLPEEVRNLISSII